MIKAKTISGRSETGNLLYFERQTTLLKQTNSKILFLLILVILKIPWTILLTDSSCVLKCLLWCMVKLCTKYYLNSTFQIFHDSRQTGLFSKNKNLRVKCYWNSDILNNEWLWAAKQTGKTKGSNRDLKFRLTKYSISFNQKRDWFVSPLFTAYFVMLLYN